MLLIENEMPVNKVAKILQVYPVRLWNVFDYWISIAHKEDVIDSLTKIGFDETSVKKGHNYITPRSRANPFAPLPRESLRVALD